MTNDLPNLDKIEDYLNGLMPEQEREQFERELDSDPSLKKEFQLVQDILAGIGQLGDEELESQIGQAQQELEAEGFFEKKTGRIAALPFDRQRWAAAASVLIVLGTALFLWLRPKSSGQDVFAAYFQAEEAKTGALIDDLSAAGLLAPNQEQRNNLAAALKLYQSGNYADARQALAGYRQKYPQDTIAQFYLGLTDLHLSNFDEAVHLLSPIAPRAPGAKLPAGLEDEITWYLALAYAGRPAEKDKDSAAALFRRLAANSSSPYAARAREALRQLE